MLGISHTQGPYIVTHLLELSQMWRIPLNAGPLQNVGQSMVYTLYGGFPKMGVPFSGSL